MRVQVGALNIDQSFERHHSGELVKYLTGVNYVDKIVYQTC